MPPPPAPPPTAAEALDRAREPARWRIRQMQAWFEVTTGLPSAASIRAASASAGSAVQETKSASACGRRPPKRPSTIASAPRRAITRSSSRPRQCDRTTSKPSASKMRHHRRGRLRQVGRQHRDPPRAERAPAPLRRADRRDHRRSGPARPIAARTASSPITTEAEVQAKQIAASGSPGTSSAAASPSRGAIAAQVLGRRRVGIGDPRRMHARLVGPDQPRDVALGRQVRREQDQPQPRQRAHRAQRSLRRSGEARPSAIRPPGPGTRRAR
jgi:hypothetical protein